MSDIFFADGITQASVYGSERGYGEKLAFDVGYGCLRVEELEGSRWPHPVRDHLRGRRLRRPTGPQYRGPDQHGLYTADISGLTDLPVGRRFTEELKTALQAFSSSVVIAIDGEDGNEQRITSTEFLYNSAMVGGSDAVALLGRVHALCEVNPWILGEDRGWLAEIITAGLRQRVLRAGQGWEDVAEFLWSSNLRTAVISWSGGESFPSAEYGSWDPAEAGHDECEEKAYQLGVSTDELEDCECIDGWYDLDARVRWERSLQGLMAAPKFGNLQISPQNLHEPIYTPGLHALMIG